MLGDGRLETEVEPWSKVVLTNNIDEKNEQDQNDYLEQVKKTFKPEFLNRLDDIIIFNRLTKNEIREIILLQINHLIKILKNKKINISLDDKAKDWLVNEGYSMDYGARPLKRIIQSKIIDKIASLILMNKIQDDQTVSFSANNNELSLSVK